MFLICFIWFWFWFSWCDWFFFIWPLCWWYGCRLETFPLRHSYFCFLNFVCHYPNFSKRTFSKQQVFSFQIFLVQMQSLSSTDSNTSSKNHTDNSTCLESYGSLTSNININADINIMESSSCSGSIDGNISEKILSNTTKPIKKESYRKHSHDGEKFSTS